MKKTTLITQTTFVTLLLGLSAPTFAQDIDERERELPRVNESGEVVGENSQRR